MEIRKSLIEYEKENGKDIKILGLCHGPIYPYPKILLKMFNGKKYKIYNVDLDEKKQVGADYRGDIYDKQTMSYFPDKYFDIVLIEDCTVFNDYDILLSYVYRILKSDGLLITPGYPRQLIQTMIIKYLNFESFYEFLKNDLSRLKDSSRIFYAINTSNEYTDDRFNCLLRTIFGFELFDDDDNHMKIYKKINKQIVKLKQYDSSYINNQMSEFRKYVINKLKIV